MSAHKRSLSVEINALTHSYGTNLAVDRISFAIESGATFGLIGPNGAGKTTTIKMLTTLLPITSGQAIINGFDVVKQPSQVRGSIGYVPQMLSADGALTGYENLLMNAKLYGLTSKFRQKRIEEVLEFMDLTQVQNKLVEEYSGGMIRRLEIGQALIHQPAVLFLDEPTVGLDPGARKTLWKHIQSLSKQLGTTVLMTTHDMEEADTLCDTVALMYLGRIVAMDNPHNLKAAVGPNASLDEVFLHHTGSLIKEKGDYSHARDRRRSIAKH